MEFKFEMNLSLVRICNLDYINNGCFSIKVKFINNNDNLKFKINYINKNTKDGSFDKKIFFEVINDNEFNIRNININELDSDNYINRIIIIEITVLINEFIKNNYDFKIILILYNNTKLPNKNIIGIYNNWEYDEILQNFNNESKEYFDEKLIINKIEKIINLKILNDYKCINENVNKYNKLFSIIFNNKIFLSLNGSIHIFLKDIKLSDLDKLRILFKKNNNLFNLIILNLKFSYENLNKTIRLIKNNIFIKYYKIIKNFKEIDIENMKLNNDLDYNEYGLFEEKNENDLIEFDTELEICNFNLFEINFLITQSYLLFFKLLKLGSYFIYVYFKLKKEENIDFKLKNLPLKTYKFSERIDKNIFIDLKLKNVLNIDFINNMKLNEYYIKFKENKLKNKGIHFIILVHGLQGNFYDLSIIRSYLLYYFPYLLILNSNKNELKTFDSIESLGKNLANEIINFIKYNNLKDLIKRISFIGYSLGGLIIRSSLKYLPEFTKKFYSYISLSSPHGGIINESTNFLIKTGILLIKNLKDSDSLRELTLNDENNYLWKLSKDEYFLKFKNYNFVGSIQDNYSPLDTSILNKLENITNLTQEKFNNICNNISSLDNLDDKIIKKTIINFDFSGLNMDIILGRTAHIQFLENKELIQ